MLVQAIVVHVYILSKINEVTWDHFLNFWMHDCKGPFTPSVNGKYKSLLLTVFRSGIQSCDSQLTSTLVSTLDVNSVIDNNNTLI